MLFVCVVCLCCLFVLCCVVCVCCLFVLFVVVVVMVVVAAIVIIVGGAIADATGVLVHTEMSDIHVGRLNCLIKLSKEFLTVMLEMKTLNETIDILITSKPIEIQSRTGHKICMFMCTFDCVGYGHQ